jgi:hypothetical protein
VPGEVLAMLFEISDSRRLPVEVRGEDPALTYRARPRHRLSEPETVVDRASDEEVVALLGAGRSARDRFLVPLLARVGLRPGEACGLRREDIHFLADARSLGCAVPGTHLHVRRRENANGAWVKSRRPAEQVGQPFVTESGLPGAVGEDAQRLPPVTGLLLGENLGVDLVHHEVKQLLLGGDVSVQPHRAGVQPGGDLAQRHRLQPALVGQRDGGGDDPLPVERHGASRRLRPVPHSHGHTVLLRCIVMGKYSVST